MLEGKLALLEAALVQLEAGFKDLPEFTAEQDFDAVGAVLEEVALRLQDNYPYAHSLYAGQMIKPPHPVARLAYSLALAINPNNHALDGGRASSQMEKEAVAALAGMFGWQTHLGHLCSGGTMANLEALWVAGSLHPGKTILASEQAHYTHARLCGVLGLPFETIASDSQLRMDIEVLEQRLQRGDVGTVVATVGTTIAGSVDPVDQILELQTRYGFRLHADAAYGGYFTLIDGLEPSTRAAYDGLSRVDSIAIDPHKHGLQPYGCGCILFADPAVGRLYAHESPYTYFTSPALHLGEISLECSRPGAAAVALWATQRLLPLTRGGAFAAQLGKSRQAALGLYEKLQQDGRFVPLLAPELDIVLWVYYSEWASRTSYLSKEIFRAAATEQLHLALARVPTKRLQPLLPHLEADDDHVLCLRSCLMKPEHLDWLERIWQALDRATIQVFTLSGRLDR